MSPNPRVLVRRRTVPRVAAIALMLSGACRAPSPTTDTRGSIDRLIDAYPEMRDGRFAVIADFEDETQLELFHVESTSGASRIARTQRDDPMRAGQHALRFDCGSSDDALVINNENAEDWYLARDWQAYDILRCAVESPRDSLILRLSVQAGPHGREHIAETNAALHRGWNELRFDLAELGEQIPLDDVRELRVGIEGSGLAAFHLDNIILTRDREGLVGDPSAKDGAMFVQRIGRRYHIGASGRFELVFGNGQIVGWYNLAEDPLKLRNFVAGTALGPMIDPSSEVDRPRMGADTALEVRTAIVEANAVRAVVATEWRHHVAAGDPRRGDEPVRRWVFTIYPTGHVFALMQDRNTEAESQAGPEVPVVVSLNVAAKVPGTEISLRQAPEPDGLGAPFAVVRASPATFVLFVPHFGKPVSFDPAPTPGGTTTTLRARGVAPLCENRSACAAALLAFVGDATFDAAALAEAFDSPPEVNPSTGRTTASTEPCSFTAGCFERSTGSYHLVADENNVRFGFGQAAPVGFAPAFVIHGSEGHDAWVYVNDRLLVPTARDADGRLIFQLTKGVGERTAVEVLLRPR